MKKVAWTLFFIIGVMLFIAPFSHAEDYKAKYERQLIVNRGMAATDAMILIWFKKHQDYKKYPSIVDKVKYLYSELQKAKEAHQKAKESAKQGLWKRAYGWAQKEWEHLNNIAVKGKKAQDNLKELESEK